MHLHENMKCDVSIIVVTSVLYLSEPVSYKELVSSCGTDAQQLLDLLQDASTSRLKPCIEMLIPTEYTVARS
jgi:hypothetical protein